MGGGTDARAAAWRGDALDRTRDGQDLWHFAGFGAAHLAQPRPAAPPVPAVQTLERPQVR